MMYQVKLFILFSLFMLPAVLMAQQVNNAYMTLTPSVYPDTVHKPSFISVPDTRNSTVENIRLQQQSQILTPASKLSVGNATAVVKQATENSASEKNKIIYIEQRLEKQETPAKSAVTTPK